MYIKISAKYQDKERLQKKLAKDIKTLLKKKKKKSNNTILNDTKKLPKNKKWKLVEYKKHYKMRKNAIL